MLVSGRHYGQLVTIPDSVGKILNDIEDAARRFSVSSGSHPLT